MSQLEVKTPLPSALFKLFSMAKAMSRKNINAHGILITDGRANAPF